jgi:TetR/AcrR family transcriptional regulator
MPQQTFFNLSEDRRRKLIRTALDLFAEHGYKKTAVEDITKLMKIGKSTIWRYFTDKEDMFIYLAQYVKEIYLDLRQNMVANIPKEEVFQRLAMMLLTKRYFNKNHPLELRFYENCLRDKSIPFWADIYKLYSDSGAKDMENILKDGITAGRIRTDIPEETVLAFITGTVDAFQKLFYYDRLLRSFNIDGDDENEVRLVADQIAILLKDALKPNNSPIR